jgi:hypothetical protein
MAWPNAGLHLGEQFTQLLADEVPALLAELDPPERPCATGRWAACTFEQNIPYHARTLGALLAQFEKRLRQLVL